MPLTCDAFSSNEAAKQEVRIRYVFDILKTELTMRKREEKLPLYLEAGKTAKATENSTRLTVL